MKEEKVLTIEVSNEEHEELEAKCIELATKYNVSKVHYCLQVAPGTHERVVSYFKEPNRPTKLAMMNKVSQIQDQFQCGEEIMKLCMLKEESNPLTYSENPATDIYYLGVVRFCIGIIEIVPADYKKK